jgi:hypothetical protein
MAWGAILIPPSRSVSNSGFVDLIAVALAVLTFAAMLAAIELLERV